MVNLSGARVFKEFVISTDNTGLNVIGIISLNLVTALTSFLLVAYILIMKK